LPPATSNSSHTPCSESSNFQTICSISNSKTVRFQLIPINTDARLDPKPYNFLFIYVTRLLPKSPVYGPLSRSHVQGPNYGSWQRTIPIFRWNLLTPSSWVLLHAQQTAQRQNAEGSNLQSRCNTAGRTPLDEWSARRRDLYLTTHNTHNRQTSMPPVGFEATISGGERPQTYALDRAATGTGRVAALRTQNHSISLLNGNQPSTTGLPSESVIFTTCNYVSKHDNS
jgi:hypothetical protein